MPARGRTWCRRGDSNPHELPHTPLKRARLPVPPLRLFIASSIGSSNSYLLGGAGGAAPVFVLPAGAGAVPAGAAGFVFAPVFAPSWAGLAAGEAAGEACGVGCASSSPTDCSTERWPVMAGSDNARATSMKRAAAPIVIFASKDCVPRGPNAVLEMLLEKSAPASALPGCKSTETIITMQDKTKSMYKAVVNYLSSNSICCN
jgi:hypothetical protein